MLAVSLLLGAERATLGARGFFFSLLFTVKIERRSRDRGVASNFKTDSKPIKPQNTTQTIKKKVNLFVSLTGEHSLG